MNFRTIIRKRMVKRNVTQTMLSDAAMISQCKLSRYLAAHKELNTDTLTRILQVLGWDGVKWGRCRLPPRR